MYKESVVLDQDVLKETFDSLQELSFDELVITKNIELELIQLEDYFSMHSSSMTEEEQLRLRHRCFKYLKQRDKYGHGAFLRQLLQFPFFKLPMHRLLDQLLLRKVNFAFLGLGDKGMIALAECIKINARIQVLNLQENRIGPLGANALFSALQKNSSIQMLDLSHNLIGVTNDEIIFGNVFVDTFKENKKLVSLHLSNNKLTDLHLIPLIDSLAENYSLEELTLSRNEFSAKGAELLAQFFTTSTSIKRMNLEWSTFLSNEVAKLISSLANTSLRVINLNWCTVCDKGAKELANALRSNQTLEEIYLNHNNITKEGGKEIGACIKDSPSLKILDLSYNCLEWEGVKPILEGAMSNKHLQEIYLINTQIDNYEAREQVKQMIEQIKATNSSLQVFLTVKLKEKEEEEEEEQQDDMAETDSEDEETKQEEQLIDAMEQEQQL